MLHDEIDEIVNAPLSVHFMPNPARMTHDMIIRLQLKFRLKLKLTLK